MQRATNVKLMHGSRYDRACGQVPCTTFHTFSELHLYLAAILGPTQPEYLLDSKITDPAALNNCCPSF